MGKWPEPGQRHGLPATAATKSLFPLETGRHKQGKMRRAQPLPLQNSIMQ